MKKNEIQIQYIMYNPFIIYKTKYQKPYFIDVHLYGEDFKRWSNLNIIVNNDVYELDPTPFEDPPYYAFTIKFDKIEKDEKSNTINIYTSEEHLAEVLLEMNL